MVLQYRERLKGGITIQGKVERGYYSIWLWLKGGITIQDKVERGYYNTEQDGKGVLQ